MQFFNDEGKNLSYSGYHSSSKKSQQLSLFESPSLYEVNSSFSSPDFVMSENFLQQWKTHIYNYQLTERQNKTQQINLITDNPDISELELIDPFALKTHTAEFYLLPQFDRSQTCLYFILDTYLPLLLYVGETKLSPRKRWVNHDCKSYIQQYVELHRKYQLPLTVRSAFYWGVSESRHLRQTWEKHLILKWRSPFNKESWQWWGQPFK